MTRQVTITFDATDPARLAEFWAVAMGYELQPPPPPFESWEAFADANDIPVERRMDISAVVDPAGVGPRLLFLKVPESKTAKNRVHLDVHCGVAHDAPKADQLAAIRSIVDELVAAGATEHESFDEMMTIWTVLTDPEGNEFCVV